MKITNFNSPMTWRLTSLALVVGFVAFLASCSETKTNKPAPTLTINPATASNTAGSAVTTTVSVSAPEGGKTLTILVNGAASTALPNVDLAGATSKDVPISFTLPATASVGATYVITFQASDNKGQNSLLSTFTATVSSKQVVQVTANITANTTWTADKIYVLNGFIRVGEDIKPGAGGAGVAPVITTSKQATLTIEAGTVILGKKGTPGGALIIQRGSKLIANGTASKPIVFTSDQAPGARTPGDWAGLVICGQAPNNIKGSTSTGTDGIEELEGGYAAYHGGGASPISNDNSGSLQYVRIEYAGYPVNPNQEINGLTLGSVGSGTTLNYIQVTYANDDSYEWFGGTVNAKYLIALKGIDDDFDTDNGFSGKVQFGLGIRAAAIADQSGSNGFECDNDAQGTSNTPFTSAEFSNMTIIGGKATAATTIDIQFQNGAQIRRNAKQKIYNSIFTGYPNGIYIDNALPGGANFATVGAVANATAGDIAFKNNILAGVEGWGGNGFGTSATADEITAGFASAAGSNHPNPPRGRAVAGGVGAFSNGVFAYSTGTGNVGEQLINSKSPILWFGDNNTLAAKWNTIGLNLNIFDPLTAPTLTATGTIATGASFTGLTGFDTTPTYRGAFGSTDWTTGWANWNPSVTDYSK